MISFLAISVLFSIKIFFCCKYKLFNFSNFFLSSSFKSFLANNLFMSSILVSNSFKFVIFSGCSDGIIKSSSGSIISSSSSSFFSPSSWSLAPSVSWLRKSTMFSFSSKTWNNSALSSKDNIFFPSISSLIAFIAFNTALIVCNKKLPERSFIFRLNICHFSSGSAPFVALNFPSPVLSLIFSIVFANIWASEQKYLLYVFLSPDISTGISCSAIGFCTDFDLCFFSPLINSFVSPFMFFLMIFCCFFSCFFTSTFSFSFSLFFLLALFCFTLLLVLFSKEASGLGIISFIISWATLSFSKLVSILDISL